MKKTYNMNHMIAVVGAGNKAYPKKYMYDTIGIINRMKHHGIFEEVMRRLDFLDLLEQEKTERKLEYYFYGDDNGNT